MVLNDLQIPFHDPVLERVLDFIKKFQPDDVALNGDVVDFYELSDFDKDPRRATNLQTELHVARKVLDVVEWAAPSAKLYWNDGNHEDRLRRWLWKHPEIATLESLTIPKLLGLSARWKYRPYQEGFWLNPEFFVVHGDIVRSRSAFTARAMHERFLSSGISGHSHRLGSYYNVGQTPAGPRVYGWWENGCLCLLKPEYVQHPQWEHGFSIVYYEPAGRFQVVQVPILDGAFIVPGFGKFGG